jgi:uncharacterized membrane protein
MTGFTRPLPESAGAETALLRAELRLEIAKLETRMTMWMGIFTMAAIAVGIVRTMAFTMGREAWPWVGFFMLGMAVQLYCVWRMGNAIGRSPQGE